VNLNHYFFFF